MAVVCFSYNSILLVVGSSLTEDCIHWQPSYFYILHQHPVTGHEGLEEWGKCIALLFL